MRFNQLNQQFYADNPDLAQILYDKNRGYGIAMIKLYDITFGIPLHSNVRKYGFIFESYQDKNGQIKRKGLDYDKAVIIDEKRHLGRTFKFPEYKIVQKNKDKIRQDFESYIKNYVLSIRTRSSSYIKRHYAFSTLQNFHLELRLLERKIFHGLNPLSSYSSMHIIPFPK